MDKKDNIIYLHVIHKNTKSKKIETKITTEVKDLNAFDKNTFKQSKINTIIGNAEGLSRSIKKDNSKYSNIIPTKLFKENIIFNKKPFYPSLAVKNGWQGTILLSILVDSFGTVANVKVLKSSEFGILNKSALSAAKKWKFKPDEYGKEFNVKKEIVFQIR